MLQQLQHNRYRNSSPEDLKTDIGALQYALGVRYRRYNVANAKLKPALLPTA